MEQPPFKTDDDHSSRVYIFDGDLSNAIYQLGVNDAFITGSIRYVLAVGDFFFDAVAPPSGGGGGGTQQTPIMSLSADNLVFADTEVGKTSPPLSLFITNTGTAPLQITGFLESAPFDFTGPTLPTTLLPGNFTEFVGVFKPTVEGFSSGIVPIISNAPSSPRLLGVQGTGLPEVVIPPVPLWSFIGANQQSTTNGGTIILPLPFPVELNDLLILCMTWRGQRYNPPDGWQVAFEANTSFSGSGTRVSTMVMYRVKDSSFISTPVLEPRLPGGGYGNASLFHLRPRNNTPRFAGLSDKELGTGEFTFEAPSLNVPNPNSLIFAYASLTAFEGQNLNPFGAVDLAAGFSQGIEFVDDGSRWGQWSYFSQPGWDALSSLSYGVCPVPAGATGKFVGTAVNRGQHRLVAIAFDGPT